MPKVFEFKMEWEGKLHCHQYHIFCPGCNAVHAIGVGIHSFNGDFERPTFQPSLLHTFYKTSKEGLDMIEKGIPLPPGQTRYPGKDYVCHSYVTNGQIQFLTDCTHELAGKTVELPEYNGDKK